jgi:hypothetical protein
VCTFSVSLHRLSPLPSDVSSYYFLIHASVSQVISSLQVFRFPLNLRKYNETSLYFFSLVRARRQNDLRPRWNYRNQSYVWLAPILHIIYVTRWRWNFETAGVEQYDAESFILPSLSLINPDSRVVTACRSPEALRLISICTWVNSVAETLERSLVKMWSSMVKAAASTHLMPNPPFEMMQRKLCSRTT